jgi:hypothetical protein
LADVGVVAFLDGCPVSVAGVINQGVDVAELAFGLAYRTSDLGAVGDIQWQCEDPV